MAKSHARTPCRVGFDLAVGSETNLEVHFELAIQTVRIWFDWSDHRVALDVGTHHMASSSFVGYLTTLFVGYLTLK